MSNKNKNYRKMYSPEATPDIVEESSIVQQTVTPDVAPTAPAASEPETVVSSNAHDYVTGKVIECTKLNVRERPRIDGTVLCVLPVGSEVRVCVKHDHDDWYEVCTASGIEGYCMKQFIQI